MTQQKTQYKNNIPHAPQTPHTKKKKIINKQYQTTTHKNGITYKNTLPLIHITYGTCPECNCPTYSHDPWRGEKVCPQCGLVLEENLHETIHTRDTYKPPNTDYTWQEKRYLQKHGHTPLRTDTQTWIKQQTNRTIQAMTSQAQLNKTQKQQTKYLIDTIGLKKLHSRANKNEIIAGVIRYILKQTQTTPTLLRYNQGIFKNTLTQETYTVIERNIQKHQRTIKDTKKGNKE